MTHPIRRRELLLALAAAGKFRFRYMIASCLYGGMTLDEIVPQVRATGAEALDVWSSHGEPVPQRDMIDAMGREAFLLLLKKRRIDLRCLTHFKLGPFGLKQELQVARELGGRGTLLVTGSKFPGARPDASDGVAMKAAVRQFVEQMKPHFAAAADAGVTIAIENHSGQPLMTPDSLRWFAEMAPAGGAGIALAPYHLPQDPLLLARLIEDLGGRIALFYAWQHGKGSSGKMTKDEELQQLPGRGPLDFAPMVRALARIRYQGWTEIFMHPFPRGIPILPTATEVTAEINRARRHLEGLIPNV